MKNPNAIIVIANTSVARLDTPFTLIVKHAPIPAINIAISAASSIKILSYQFSFIPSCFAVLPTPNTITGTSAIIIITKNGIKNAAFWSTNTRTSYKIEFIDMSSTYSKLFNTDV